MHSSLIRTTQLFHLQELIKLLELPHILKVPKSPSFLCVIVGSYTQYLTELGLILFCPINFQ